VLATSGNIDDSMFLETTQKTLFSEEIGFLRTDKYGSYAVSKIDYPSIDSVEDLGISSDRNAALEFYIDFVSTEVIDSIALDDFSRYDEWLKDVAPKYVTAELLSTLSSAQTGNNPAAIIFNNHDPNVEAGGKNLLPVLARDGKPRVFNKSIWGLSARGGEGGGLYIWGMGSATVITDAEKGLEWDAILTGGDSGEDFGFYKEGMPNAGPLLFQVGLTLVKDGEDWKIAGYSNSFTTNSFEFFKEVPQKLIDWRNAIQ